MSDKKFTRAWAERMKQDIDPEDYKRRVECEPLSEYEYPPDDMQNNPDHVGVAV